MNDYTVHLKGSPDDLAALERAIFVREGFAWAALLFGPLWLLWNRLWLALAIWLLIEAGLIAWAVMAAPAHFATTGLQLLMHVALAYEAAPLRRAGLLRRRWQMISVVQGRRFADAERAFFSRFGVPRLAPTQELSGVAGRPRATGMVGLFPSAGA